MTEERDDQDEQDDPGSDRLRRPLPRPSIPDVRSRLAGNRRQITLALIVAFVIQVVSQVKEPSGKDKLTQAKLAAGGTNFIAWIVVVMFLAIASDFDATSDLARAFALLILLTVLLRSGPKAMENVQKLTEQGSKEAAARRKKADAKA